MTDSWRCVYRRPGRISTYEECSRTQHKHGFCAQHLEVVQCEASAARMRAQIALEDAIRAEQTLRGGEG